MKSSKAFTLIELLIVIVISGVIFAVLAPLITSAFNSFFIQTKITDANWQGRLAMGRMTRDLRVIPANNSISTAGSSSLVYTDFTGSTVTYQLSGSTLQLNGNTLASGVNSLLFEYFDSNGATTATIANIRYIRITLNVTEYNTNTILQTVVNLREITS